jgi:thiol:disulfide interchange protein
MRDQRAIGRKVRGRPLWFAVACCLCCLLRTADLPAQRPNDAGYRQNAEQLADRYLNRDYLRSVCDSARAAKKVLLFYFHATWCPACRNLEEFVFPDVDVSTMLQGRFLFVSLDGSVDFDGIEMAQKFKIGVYPTLLAIDHNGREIQRLVGYHGEVELLEKLGRIPPCK